MKTSAIALLIVITGFLSCTKKADLPAPLGEYGMNGTVAENSWVASSLNASVNKEEDGTYELVVNGWKKSSDQTVYIVVKNYEAKQERFIINSNYVFPKHATAFYQKDHGAIQNAVSGVVEIINATNDVVEGSYEFVVNDGTKLRGAFNVHPYYSN